MEEETKFPSLSAPASRTLSDHIADQLRHSIMVGQLKPGQRIVEREIADAMQTSRGPVRDALKQLENEGVVIRYPHRGTFVARLSLKDAEEIHTLRQSLEALAVEYAIRNAEAKQIEELAQVVDQITDQIAHGYSQLEATDLDLEFHHTLCRISGHKRVLTAWESLKAQIRMLLFSHRTLKPAHWEQAGVLWHSRIVDALRQRDVDMAQAELRKHLIETFQGVAQSFAAQKAEQEEKVTGSD